MNRREFVRRLVVSSLLIATGVSGIVELANLASKRAQLQATTVPVINPQQQSTVSATTSQFQSESATTTSGSATSSNASAPAGYVFIAAMSQLSGKTYAYFTHPSYGNSILVNVSRQWKAFSATCTHRPCTVDYQSSEIYCPCHGGAFDPSNGSVTGGPPPSPLPEFSVQILNNNLYVSTSRVN
jgi:Rieske Fe-S protein